MTQQRVHWPSGLLFCAECGEKMRFHSGAYVCAMKGCGRVFANAVSLEDTLWAALTSQKDDCARAIAWRVYVTRAGRDGRPWKGPRPVELDRLHIVRFRRLGE